jgi:ABC-type transport system involved in multi-copper enzyme maturation permease subunit
MNLLHSEWIKLFTTRTTWVMLGIGLFCEGLFMALIVSLVPADELDQVREMITGTGLLMTLLLVLGVLIITTEFRHGTASSTFLVSPQRGRVLLAKLVAAVLVGLLAGLLFVVVNGGIVLPVYNDRVGGLPPSGDLVEIYAGVVASFALLAAFGLGVGAIIRNQVGAIVAAIAFFFIISSLPYLLPGNIGEYFPASALGSLHGHTEGEGELGQVGGGLVLAAWSFGLWALGTVMVARRDLSD